jgi:hypothetical protein
MRTPETHYFDHGYVKFKKIEGQLYYQVWQYTGDGMMSMVVLNGKVTDESHLKALILLTEVPKPPLGSVKHG